VFDGETGFGITDAPGPVSAQGSFSVAAWVSLARPAEFAAAVSQLGDIAGVFFLGVAEENWDFTMKTADTNEPGISIRASSGPADADDARWVHLAGVHDADAREIRLYVDGQEVAVTAFSGAWDATGALTVGRSQAHGQAADFWPGAVADVRVFAVALGEEQVGSEFARHRPTALPPPLPPAPTDEVSVFRRERDEICVAGTDDVAAINKTMEGATMAELGAAMRQIAERTIQTQRDLAELSVPAALETFVREDAERRAARLQLTNELAEQLELGDLAEVQRLDEELTEVNIATEAAEDANGLEHCP
jgi:hypothetical protein